MRDLELERAELLPSRETLYVSNYYPAFVRYGNIIPSSVERSS
jgi:hypothetical protein